MISSGGSDKAVFMLRLPALAALAVIISLALPSAGFCLPSGGDTEMSRQEIVRRLEEKYGGSCITADFVQTSTLEAMDITDTAKGKAWFKHPGMMRWEYKTPDEHAIITDGETLWIHRPADSQVIVGNALDYFGNGKGASFLSNISLVKEAFDLEKTQSEEPGCFSLKLTPKKKSLDISRIILNIEKKDFTIKSVDTKNAYGDVTSIEFRSIRFKEEIPASKFEFRIPPGADVLKMEEQKK